MIPQKHFYMIRHGETEANLNRVMAGSLDSPLTSLGRKQADAARLVVEALKVKPTRVFHSHLSRARDTAAIINQNLKLPMIEDPDFAEIHVGDLEGASWDDCVCFDDWIDPPNGETFPQFFDRIRRAKKKALETGDGPALIVCHGGVFRAVYKMHGIDMPGVPNARLHEFSPLAGGQPMPWLVHIYEDDFTKSEADYP